MNKNQKLNRVEEGIARNVNWERVVQSSTDRTDILSLTIEQTDHQGNPVRYIPVYCEANQIKGVLVDGDPIIVVGTINKNGILNPEKIFNIRTQSYILLIYSSSILLQVFIVVLIFFAAFVSAYWIVRPIFQQR